MNRLLNFLNHERYKIIAALVIALLAVVYFGCQSRVHSLIDPDKWITRPELMAELDLLSAQSEADLLRYQAQGEAKLSSLDRQDSFKRWVAEEAALFAESGQINPGGLVLSLVGLFGLGMGVDDIRTRRKIKPAAPPADGDG